MLVGIVLPLIIPYVGRFPYKELLTEFGLPKLIYSLANFDGIHYILIAKQGYSQYEQAFFPLYPLIIRYLSLFVPNQLVVGIAISNICFYFGLVFFWKTISKIFPQRALIILCALLLFPTSFFFHLVYTEGLFFLLFWGSLYCVLHARYKTFAFFAALSSATRLIGIVLIVPFVFNVINFFSPKKKLFVKNLIYMFSPFVGLLIYMGYLWQSTGDPFFFFTAQPAFGANRSTSIILLPQVYFRYFKIFFLSNFDFAYFVALVEFFTVTFVLISVATELIVRFKNKNGFLFALALVSLVNILLPSLTGTFSSAPRYALFSPSVFFYVGTLKNKGYLYGILLVFALLQIVLFGFFLQGYFVS